MHVCQSPSDCPSRAGGVHVPSGASTFAKAGVKPSFRHKVRQLQNNNIAAIGLCGLLCLVKPSIRLGRQLRRQLSTIPSQEMERKRRQREPKQATREAAGQTSPRRRQGQLPHRETKTKQQMERERGVERELDSNRGERADDRCPRTASAQTQTGARRRIAGGGR